MLSMSDFGDPMHPGDAMPESSIGIVALGKVGACTVGFSRPFGPRCRARQDDTHHGVV